jgi:phage terminase large subunit-like protein
VSGRDYAAIAEQYARDVVAGTILACRWTIAACQRQLNDLARAETAEFPYRYEPARGARVCTFIELLTHIKGKWARKPIRLEAWQIFIVMTVFSWVWATAAHADPEIAARDGFRRFRTSYLEVPRKNAKSTLTSGIGLYMLALDDEGGAECYSAATTRDQAKIVWSDARTMALRSPEFCDRFGVEVLAHAITIDETSSKFIPLAAEDGSLDGLNVHFACNDELHAHKTRGLYDVLETATGARTQSLIWNITTAGSNRSGICYEQRTYLTKLLQGVAVDESFFGIIYSIDDEDDWTDPSVWAKANPNYGVSVFPDDIARLCRKAQEMPSAQGNFLTKRLNVWVNADTTWMDMRAWDRCKDDALTLEQFEGERCIDGLDLASKVDIAAKVRVFSRLVDGNRHFYAFGRYYLPESAAEESGNSQYPGWIETERILTTPGNVIDFDTIEQELREDASRFELAEVAYDPFQATQLSTRLTAEGFTMVEMRPIVLNFSEPMKELEALVLSGRFHHDGDPVLAWMVSNVVCHRDQKDNIYPRKERVENKIDGVVALIMALGRWITQPEAGDSVYETRGVRTL